MRSVLMAAGISVVLPMIDAFGVAVTNALCAILVWVSFGYVLAGYPSYDCNSGLYIYFTGSYCVSFDTATRCVLG